MPASGAQRPPRSYLAFALSMLAALGSILPSRAAEPTGQQSCLECHENFNTRTIKAWRESKHAAHNVGCVECHGTDHSTIFEQKGQVSAAVCAKCHEKEAQEFDLSLHAAADDFMRADPKFARLPASVAELGCVGCHQIGARFTDGSRGKCNSCHSSHSFSVVEARRPEACAMCHTGADHPHMAMWQSSKHGQLFASEKTRDQAPTCVTCHMPKGTHNTSIGLTFGHVGNGAVAEGTKAPVKMRTMTQKEIRTQRNAMIQTCLPCHSSRFATDALNKADAFKKDADAVLFEAVNLISALHDEGLLIAEGNVNPPAGGAPATHSLVLGSDQVYDGLSDVEQRFFDMFKFHHSTGFKGAYHHSPDHTHNEGYMRMKQDLTYLKNEAARLRAQAREQTNKTRIAENP